MEESLDVSIKPDIMVDSKKGLLIVKRGTVVVKNVRFDGTVIAGAGSNFLGGINAKEVYLSKGCTVNGKIKCDKIIVGAKSRFKSIECSGDVVVLDRCFGESIKASGNVRIGNSVIMAVEANGVVVVDGSAKLEKLIASKVVASSGFKCRDVVEFESKSSESETEVGAKEVDVEVEVKAKAKAEDMVKAKNLVSSESKSKSKSEKAGGKENEKAEVEAEL